MHGGWSNAWASLFTGLVDWTGLDWSHKRITHMRKGYSCCRREKMAGCSRDLAIKISSDSSSDDEPVIRSYPESPLKAIFSIKCRHSIRWCYLMLCFPSSVRHCMTALISVILQQICCEKVHHERGSRSRGSRSRGSRRGARWGGSRHKYSL